MEIICLREINPEAAALLSLLPRVRVLGAYAETDLTNIIPRIKPHLAWFPFAVPETHSYTLSEAMSFGLPVLASGIGAVPERVIGRQSTWLVPFDGANADSHFQWIERLYCTITCKRRRCWCRCQSPTVVVEEFFPTPISNRS